MPGTGIDWRLLLAQGIGPGLGQNQNKALAVLQYHAVIDSTHLLLWTEARELLCQPSDSLGAGYTQETVIVADIDQFGLLNTAYFFSCGKSAARVSLGIINIRHHPGQRF